MLTIISKEKINNAHNIQSHSYREEVWLDGYVEVPEHLIEKAWKSCGYCDLVFDDDGNLVEIVPTEKPEPTPEESAEELNFDALASAIREGVNSL